MASFWDQLGNTALGGLSGYLTGGGIGGALGGITGALNKKPLTFGSSLDTALKGAGAGAIGKGLGGILGKAGGMFKFPGGNTTVPTFGAGPGQEGPPSRQFEAPAESGIPSSGGQVWGEEQGWGDRALRGIGSAANTVGSWGKGALDRMQGAGGGIGGVLGQARGIFGGSGGGQGRAPAGTPDNPQVMEPGGGVRLPGGQGARVGTPSSGWQDLAKAAGLGLGAYGLANQPGSANLEEVFAGSEGQTRGAIDARIAAEAARRQQAEEQFQTGRAGARTQLEQVLGQGSDEAMRQAIQGRQEQLNRQGLLSGPSGAMDFAVAQEAAKLRQSQLPRLLDFDLDTQRQLEAQRFGGLDAEMGLGRAGLEREFGLGDARRTQTLRQKLLDLETKRRQNKAIMGAAGGALGYGFGGGAEGARAGLDIGRTLESVLQG